MSYRPEKIISRPTFTGCCFAGPVAGKIFSADSRVMLIALPRKPLTEISPLSDPIEPIPWREDRYTYEQFRHRDNIYGCWVYEDGWIEDEPVKRHIELAMQTMWEIARGMEGGRWV